MRQILLNPVATLSRRAGDKMAELVAKCTVDKEGTVLRTTRTGCRLVDLCRPPGQRRPCSRVQLALHVRQSYDPGALLAD
jgi:hypothetical protein